MGGVMFICTGNTCRSPMAEALARRFGGGAEFFSRGVSAMDGGAASPMAVRVMRELYGIDLTGHISRPVTEADVSNANLILTMTESHRQRLASLFPFACDKLYTLYGFARADSDERYCDIADPYMSGFDVYAACADEIKKCLDLIDFSCSI